LINKYIFKRCRWRKQTIRSGVSWK